MNTPSRFGVSLVAALALSACSADSSSNVEDATASSAHFETFKGADGKTYFQLIAKNGAEVLHSQGYSSLTSAKGGITSVKSNGATKTKYQVQQADNGEYYFNLVAGNGQTIGTSETYSTSSNANAGVTAVMSAVSSASSTSASAKAGPKFETFTGSDGKTYFHLRAQNGQIVLASQAYSSKSSATSGVASVESNGADATNYKIIEGQNGQFTFDLFAANHKVIGHGEMYASKSGALAGSAGVVSILRDLGGLGISDDQVKAEISTAFNGLLFGSESDYPFDYVSTPFSAAQTIDDATMRARFEEIVDSYPNADAPLSSLYVMEKSWEDFKGENHSCADPSDDSAQATAACTGERNLEATLEANLTDIHVFYFGKNGQNGNVQGIGVTVFIVGRTPSGTLAGVRTLAIWT